MSSPRPSQGVVTIAALDLRRRPDHKSELKSQLLLGEVVRALSRSRDGRWWRIENRSDGYRGWIRTWGIVPVSRKGASEWMLRARGRVVVPYAEARQGRGTGALVTPLFWAGRLVVGAVSMGYRRISLPDRRRAWVRSIALEVGRPRRWDLMRRVRGLLGVPYLWGGRTPMGMDCSALTQLLLGEQGIELPRDAEEQFRASRPLRRDEIPRPGDLVFFGATRGRVGHVGVALGGGYYVHSRGRVRINSIDPDNILWDKELHEQNRGFRRPESGPVGGPREVQNALETA